MSFNTSDVGGLGWLALIVAFIVREIYLAEKRQPPAPAPPPAVPTDWLVVAISPDRAKAMGFSDKDIEAIRRLTERAVVPRETAKLTLVKEPEPPASR